MPTATSLLTNPLTIGLAGMGTNAYLQRRTARRAQQGLLQGNAEAEAAVTAAGTGAETVLKDASMQAGNVFTDVNNGQIGAANAALDNQRTLLQPYVDAGTTSLKDLQARTQEFDKPYDKTFQAPTAETLYQDPGYKFRMEEGEKQINRQAAAHGVLQSGGTLKALQRYGQDYASNEFGTAYERARRDFDTAFDQARTNQNDRIARLTGLTQIGQTAAGQEVGAEGQRAQNVIGAASEYGGRQGQNILQTGNQVADTRLRTGENIADLRASTGEVNATGDVAAGNATTGAIAKGIDFAQQAMNLKSLGGTGLKMAAAGAPAALAMAPGSAASIAGLGAPAAAAGIAPVAPSAIVGAPGAVAPGGSAAAAFLTNPWTIGIGAGIIAGTAVLKSQAHWEANTLGKDVQAPFNKNLTQAHDAFFQAAENGQLTTEQARQGIDQMKQMTQSYITNLDKFAKKGKDEKKVADQAKATMAKYYGADFSGLLGGMESVYTTLAGQGATA